MIDEVLVRESVVSLFRHSNQVPLPTWAEAVIGFR